MHGSILFPYCDQDEIKLLSDTPGRNVMFELEKKDYQRIAPLFNGIAHNLAVQSALKGSTPARIWVDDVTDTKCAVLWEMVNGSVYCDMRHQLNGFQRHVRLFLVEKLMNELKQQQYTHFDFQLTPLTRLDVPQHFFPEMECNINRMTFFYGDASIEEFLPEPSPIPSDYSLERITTDILGNDNLTNLDEVRRCIQACWGSVDRYLDQGIGFCLVRDHTLVTWCSTDFLFNRTCELYVETFEPYRNRNLASMAADACIRACLQKRLKIHWHCWENNTGSVRLAQKLGLIKILNSPVYCITLENVLTIEPESVPVPD